MAQTWDRGTQPLANCPGCMATEGEGDPHRALGPCSTCCPTAQIHTALWVEAPPSPPRAGGQQGTGTHPTLYNIQHLVIWSVNIGGGGGGLGGKGQWQRIYIKIKGEGGRDSERERARSWLQSETVTFR